MDHNIDTRNDQGRNWDHKTLRFGYKHLTLHALKRSLRQLSLWNPLQIPSCEIVPWLAHLWWSLEVVIISSTKFWKNNPTLFRACIFDCLFVGVFNQICSFTSGWTMILGSFFWCPGSYFLYIICFGVTHKKGLLPFKSISQIPYLAENR